VWQGYAAHTGAFVAGSRHARHPPIRDDLAEIAEQYRFGLSAQDVESFRAIIAGAMASYDAVERMYAARLPQMPHRPYR